MPVLANVRHEQVAQQVARGIDQTHAYMTAYPKSSEEAARRSASALMTKPDVQARVRELTTKSAEQAVVTAQMILERAWAVANSDAKDRAQHLAIAARAFPEFRDGPVVDNRSLMINVPEGTTLEDLKRLRAEMG